MIDNLPIYISLNFILITLVAIFIFYKASSNNIAVLLILIFWSGIQSAISLTGFYQIANSMPPRFILVPVPALILMLFLFMTNRGRKFIDSLNLKTLTWLHVIRIPVEITLLLLFMFGKIPKLMTFEGRNFDIISGATAILIIFFAFKGQTPRRNLLLGWNFICLGLLLNIVVNAIFSVPFPFQKFGFEQPNIAILYFPFVLLPATIVPIVLFSHLAAIRKLIKKID